MNDEGCLSTLVEVIVKFAENILWRQHTREDVGMSDLDQFKQLVDLAIRVSDMARSHPVLSQPNREEGHFINENTLVRIDEQLESIRDKRETERKPDWLKDAKYHSLPGFDAYITMRVYRNSIVHHMGTLNEEFHGGPCCHSKLGEKTSGRRRQFKSNYERFCNSLNDLQDHPLKPGEPLMLSVRAPDFLSKLLEDVLVFAQAALGPSFKGEEE